MIKVGNKRDVNKFVKQIRELAPDAEIKEGSLVVTCKIEGETLFSALKCRGGWSLLFKPVTTDKFLYSWTEGNFPTVEALNS